MTNPKDDESSTNSGTTVDPEEKREGGDVTQGDDAVMPHTKNNESGTSSGNAVDGENKREGDDDVTPPVSKRLKDEEIPAPGYDSGEDDELYVFESYGLGNYEGLEAVVKASKFKDTLAEKHTIEEFKWVQNEFEEEFGENPKFSGKMEVEAWLSKRGDVALCFATTKK